MHRRAVPILIAALAIPSAAVAKPHDGLLVRVTPGVSSAAAAATVDDQELSIRGGAGQLGIAAGWAVAPRLIIALELMGHAIIGPELEIDGDVTETDDDVSWGVSYAGLGVNYYFRNNIYVAGSGGPLIMTIDSDMIEKAETDLGGAAKVAVGYEWLLGSRVGLGLAIDLMAGAVPDGDATWGVATLGLALSATYN